MMVIIQLRRQCEEYRQQIYPQVSASSVSCRTVVLAVLPTTAACTDSRTSVHLLSAAYLFFSRLCLIFKVVNLRSNLHGLNDDQLFIQFQPHPNLVNSPFDLSFKNEANEELFNLCCVDIQLL